MLNSFDINAAVRVQNRLGSHLALSWTGGRVQTVGGGDVAYDLCRARVTALLVVCSLPGFEVIETASATVPLAVPYLRGFLSFREGPAFIRAFRLLKKRPDVTLFDGNGIAHPRRMGLASYVGVVLDVPTIGCAKKPFYPFRLPGARRGSAAAYRDESGKQVGLCLRTSAGVKPIFMSPGHRVDFAAARRIVLDCSRFRVPEPLRLAHQLASKASLS